MTRANCQHPADCVAGARGPCRRCSDLRGAADQMRKLHADPVFAKATAERLRKLHADPEFAKAHAARSGNRMSKLNAEKLSSLGVPHGAEELFRLARRKGFPTKEAVSFAKREAAE